MPHPEAHEWRQLVLEFPADDGYGAENFMPSSCNEHALQTVLAWPDWPQPACLLVGPAGSGRTHLARIWAARAGAVYVGGRSLWTVGDPLALLADGRALVIDDADLAEHERRLLELYNLVVQRGGHLLLTAARPAALWGISLPDLRSRLEAATMVTIEPPDDGLLAALLVKQFADRQLRVDPGVVRYLIAHMDRTFAAARRVVATLDRLSLATRRAVTMPLARLALGLEHDQDGGGEARAAHETSQAQTGGG